MTRNEFLSHCTACGNNWTAMLLTGIEEVFPDAYKALPDFTYSFGEVAWIVSCLIGENESNFTIDIESHHRWEFSNGTFTAIDLTREEREMPWRELFAKYGIPID